jgi:palmitoyl-protein thioesterase
MDLTQLGSRRVRYGSWSVLIAQLYTYNTFCAAGQFWRAYVERYNSPPVHNLITFGSQHMGVSDLPPCRPFDVLCQLARRAARGGVYSEWAQKNVVSVSAYLFALLGHQLLYAQAQYYRDPDRLPLYLENNHFLPDINNEIPGSVNKTYAQNIKSLNKLVLVLFTEDKTVVPKETSWFGSYAPQEDDVSLEKTIIPIRRQPLYVNDTIGLRAIDERGDLMLETCKGDHMVLENCWKSLVEKYVGGPVHDAYSVAMPNGQAVFDLSS